MPIGTLLKGLKIQDLSRGGNGVTREVATSESADGKPRVIFVPFTVPGDVVTVKIASEERRFATADLVSVDEGGGGLELSDGEVGALIPGNDDRPGIDRPLDRFPGALPVVLLQETVEADSFLALSDGVSDRVGVRREVSGDVAHGGRTGPYHAAGEAS